MDSNKKHILAQIENHKKILLDDQANISLTKILSSEQCQRILVGCREFRDRVYTPIKTVFIFIKQVLNPDKSCKKAVTGVAIEQINAGNQPVSINTGPYCKARKRLPDQAVYDLVKETGSAPIRSMPQSWKVYGRNVIGVDGSTGKAADTKENQIEFPQHNNQKEGAGFPIFRYVAIMSLTLGTILDYAIGAYKGKGTGEASLLRTIIGSIKKDDIVLGDRYFPSYFLMADIKKIGADGIFKGQAQRHYDFRSGTRLDKNDHVVYWEKPNRPQWMSQEDYDAYPDRILVREFKVSGNVYITTFLNANKYHKKELASIYRCRWHVEINLKYIKSVMNMDMLTCKTPDMVRKEIGIHFLAYNFIRIIMAEACIRHAGNPLEVSFKGSVQLLTECMPHFLRTGTARNEALYEQMLKLIVKNKIGNRPGRIEPRMIKQRHKPFPTLKRNRSTEREILMRKVNRKIAKYEAA